jgi:hypothetical protein
VIRGDVVHLLVRLVGHQLFVLAVCGIVGVHLLVAW